MLTKRIIPCLDVKAGRVVKGIQFEQLRDAGDPVECAKAYDAQGADELVFLDITASHEERNIMHDVVARTAEQCFMPLTVGGGLRTLDDIELMLKAGADKVSLNTAAIKNPKLIADASARFGNQCIVVAIDAKRAAPAAAPAPAADATTASAVYGLPPTVYGSRYRADSDSPLARQRQTVNRKPETVNRDGEAVAWRVYTHGGRHPTELDAIAWAREAVALGAGEILLTSMDCDGTQNGYDCALTRAVSDAVPVPVIASGGAGKLEHFADALTEGRASAALAASLFHFGTLTIPQVKNHLLSRDIPVRAS